MLQGLASGPSQWPLGRGRLNALFERQGEAGPAGDRFQDAGLYQHGFLVLRVVLGWAFEAEVSLLQPCLRSQVAQRRKIL